MKKKTTNKLDEMQEQKMLKIERNGCWFAFWGLFGVLFIQVIIYGYGEDNWKYMVGEWVVFMCLALYISIDCLRNGIWDRRLSPTPIANICASVISGVVVCVMNFAASYRDYHMLVRATARGIITGIMVFVLCFAALSCAASIYKKRVAHMEQEDTDEDEEQPNAHIK